MADLQCRRCELTATYADASAEDLYRSCPGEDTPDSLSVVRHGPGGPLMDGDEHDWTEVQA